MTAAETTELLQTLRKDGFGQELSLFDGLQDAALVVPREQLHAVLKHLRDARHLSFELLVLITGTHMIEKKDPKTAAVLREEHFEVIYHLRSIKHRRILALKVRLPFADPTLPSAADVWLAADWHERETWDLLGIRFTGHPNLRRILLPEDWEGHPLRKDYAYPKSYQGINLEVDAPWPTP